MGIKEALNGKTGQVAISVPVIAVLGWVVIEMIGMRESIAKMSSEKVVIQEVCELKEHYVVTELSRIQTQLKELRQEVRALHDEVQK